ncbi:MAG: hypothetical protein A3D96_04455 [Chlamydiae bacterium RIFCSPHIGHO2_12_FULL_44_59]|nr:MAG: hypothetical protein A2796_04230 [Chlamydiae bacterium RIFCSPHIGHO2_01_FULL_44_39]OGN58311.1 MAG: hypothetical protein A3C42_00980 [Chlamydiae bacterium RIFCSPHIGHO2_02_FULL_45_9]OGN60340.1 MAG: hypothetical protein A3D96_04455 [Chlamydiae bacterium RIFCSPHIGHO2_12_FULL_44_59]OGN66323.1 MAG: hypothetical protein A2978_01900 [Chlamydiae bacterium RIFCSPLOWO2_01_FULL_44_52]OGN69274.1 MAG: hypothetical protein A3I67_00760 [Chlamydiae bacterium RIFCSPLOWO2_02_FULL_45_22]OGN70214.1 MAG: hyp
MSSTEPPSRVPPRESGHESKAAREQLSSKGKVEKVREVDPDEETRKKRFLKFYKEDDADTEESSSKTRPTPFELYTQTEKKGGNLQSSLGDVEDGIIPGPQNAPPPNLNQNGFQEDDEESYNASQALPQSEGFWENVNLPDEPLPKDRALQETDTSDPRNFKAGSSKNKAQASDLDASKKKENAAFGGSMIGPKKKDQEESLMDLFSLEEEKKKRHETVVRAKTKHSQDARIKQKIEQEKSSREENFKETPRVVQRSKELEKEHLQAGKQRDEKGRKERQEGEDTPMITPILPESTQQDKEGFSQKEPKVIEIESLASPPLPAQVESLAQAATVQGANYLHPTTVSLFFQMVGTLYVLQNSGISRTEIVLNNPSYSNSKFFGSTITIEKYSTAPDSFNIRLTGSNQAVVAFKENIPSLMTAFENSNLPFRVNRIDVGYSADKPVFRRRDREAKDGDASGGGLGEKRK